MDVPINIIYKFVQNYTNESNESKISNNKKTDNNENIVSTCYY